MFQRRTNVYFIYSQQHRTLGSTITRGQQLFFIAQRFFPGDYKLRFVPFKKRYRNSILFLTKGALKTLTEEDLATTKARGNKLIFDPVDDQLPSYTTQYADVIATVSETGYKDYARRFPNTQVTLIDHHIDPRVPQYFQAKAPTDKLAVGYFGELVNGVLTPAIQESIDVIHVDTSKQDEAWFKKLGNYNMHYAVRPPKAGNVHKSFLKGIIAAHCGANILISDQELEAVRWLGKDYPYLIHGQVTEKAILSALDHAQKSYGTAEWKQGLAVMKKLKAATEDEVIAEQLKQLLDGLAA